MEALPNEKLHCIPIIPEFVTQLHIIAPFSRYLSSKTSPNFQRDSSALCHSTTAAGVQWRKEPASQGRVTSEAAGAAKGGLDSIIRFRRGDIRTQQLLVVNHSMPGTTTGEKMAKTTQHLEG